MKKIRVLYFICFLTLLSGCSINTDELLKVPQLPAQYIQVKKQIDQLLTGGVELCSPISGSNRSSIQMVDLDGDGEEEALAFCSVKSGDEVGLRFYVFKKALRGHYVQTACIDGEGDSFSVVEYLTAANYTGKQLLVGWRLGANPVMGLTVFRYENGELKALANEEYTGMLIDNFDADSQDELLLMRHMTSGTDTGKAILYDVGRDDLKRLGEAPLSAGIRKPDSIQYTFVGANIKGIVIDGKLEAGEDNGTVQTSNGMISDLLIYNNTQLTNITFDSETKCSQTTFRPSDDLSRDTDNDGIVEIPRVTYLQLEKSAVSTQFLKIDWCWVIREGSDSSAKPSFTPKYTAYTRMGADWMFRMPEELLPSVTLTMGYNEDELYSVVFYSYNSETQSLDKPLWEIFCISGPRRNDIAHELGVSELSRGTTDIYGVKLYTAATDKIITLEEISRCFILRG